METSNDYIFYGEEKVIELMPEHRYSQLFYVLHNTKELLDEFLCYCKRNKLDASIEDSAILFTEYQEKIFEEALNND